MSFRVILSHCASVCARSLDQPCVAICCRDSFALVLGTKSLEAAVDIPDTVLAVWRPVSNRSLRQTKSSCSDCICSGKQSSSIVLLIQSRQKKSKPSDGNVITQSSANIAFTSRDLRVLVLTCPDQPQLHQNKAGSIKRINQAGWQYYIDFSKNYIALGSPI